MLIIWADSLKDLADHIGGSQYIMTLIQPLEYLASVEENTVRETAIESIKKILNPSRIKENEQLIKVMLTKMMSSELFYSKIACVCLTPYIYKFVSQQLQTELLK